MIKRLYCLFLAACCLAPLAACGQNNSSSSAPEASSVPAASSPAVSTPAPEPTPEPVPEPETAATLMQKLSLEQKVAQMFFARCPEEGAADLLTQYDIGGYVLFGRDFETETVESMQQKLALYQKNVATPMLLGTDEEGGTVVRVSFYPQFREYKFRSPQQLFSDGGVEENIRDTVEKDALLKKLGINVNLAPVCDVSTDPNDFIYARAFGQGAKPTADYVQLIVTQMVQDDMGCVLKHFPGYGNNVDTHTGIAIDDRSLDSFRTSDFLPFSAGIRAGAGSVLVSHNVVNSMDSTLPASLSPAVHQILRDELSFNGVILTDDLAMEAITDYTGGADAAVLAVQAGNDMLLSSDFEAQYAAVLQAVQDGTISEDTIDAAVTRILQWKIDLGLIKLD